MDSQNFTETELTDGENVLLEVLLNPLYKNKTVTEICKAADVSRPIYYTAFKKDHFVRKYESMSKELLKQSLAPVVNAFIEEAKKGSYHHGKAILEMAGLYQENLNVTANVKVKIVDDIEDDIDDSDE